MPRSSAELMLEWICTSTAEFFGTLTDVITRYTSTGELPPIAEPRVQGGKVQPGKGKGGRKRKRNGSKQKVDTTYTGAVLFASALGSEGLKRGL